MEPQDTSDAVDTPTAEQTSRYRRARRRVEETRRDIIERANQLEESVPAARTAFRAYDHDRAVGGEIMAGAIAFRAFVFLIPLVLVLVSLLGIATDADPSNAEAVVKQAGIAGIAAEYVTQSQTISNGGRWFALFLGLIALYSTSIALARALRIAHALAWGKRVAPMRRSWRAALIVTGATLGLGALASVVSRVHASHPGADLFVALGSVVVYAGAWFGISLLLPHGDSDWTALLPGAALVGVGVLGLHLVTVYYVAHKISHASSLYGPLGAAVAILGWTYLVGRLTVASAVLNASHHQRSAAGVEVDPPPGPVERLLDGE